MSEFGVSVSKSVPEYAVTATGENWTVSVQLLPAVSVAPQVVLD